MRLLRLGVLAAVVVAFLIGLAGLLGFTAVQSGTTEDEAVGCQTGLPPVIIPAGDGAITWPMQAGSYRISSGYGPRWGSFHHGVDMAAPIGTPIYAAAGGVVRASGPADGFGTWVVLDHVGEDGARYSTVYGHNSRNVVAAGQTVAAGQHIADVGNEGQSTGPHLHFEVWPGGRLDGGASTDPTPWLNANATSGGFTPVAPRAPPASPLVAAVLDDTLTGPVPPQGPQSSMTLDAEQRANAETIVGVVKGDGLPLRVAVIAIATAMQESTLRVIDYGDLAGPDSRGLFQQRTWWGPYEARMDPVQSTRYFLHGGAGGQRGLLSHNWRGMSLEDVVVATQISVGGYAKWERQAMQVVAELSGVAPVTGVGFPTPCTV